MTMFFRLLAALGFGTMWVRGHHIGDEKTRDSHVVWLHKFGAKVIGTKKVDERWDTTFYVPNARMRFFGEYIDQTCRKA